MLSDDGEQLEHLLTTTTTTGHGLVGVDIGSEATQLQQLLTNKTIEHALLFNAHIPHISGILLLQLPSSNGSQR